MKVGNMKIIYQPAGKAREYSPLAANLYTGCGHKCSYCYVPGVTKVDRTTFDTVVNERRSVIEQLRRDAESIRGSRQQVFMSFTTDPYNPVNNEAKLTRQALLIFLENRIPVSILTKSGLAAMQDLDLFKMFGDHIKIGASLTYDNDADSQRIESGAALPGERLEMLRQLHDAGVRTWVSFEPMMQPRQTLNLMHASLKYVSEYQFGKLADDKRVFDWNAIVSEIVNTLRPAGIPFYIKHTLREAASRVSFYPYEREMDYLTLPPFPADYQPLNAPQAPEEQPSLF